MTSAPPPFRLGFGLACLAIGLIIMLPELLLGTSYSYSFRYNLVWGQQIVEQMLAGEAYPRWLSGSWDGLGAPTFYFYAPIFFLTAGGLGVMGGGALPLSVTLALASALFIALSGVTMERWLVRVAAPRTAAIGALAYMVAPYHLHEIYSRGALAEASIYVAMPLVLCGLFDLKQGKRHAIPVLGAGYGLLILSHLPVALLASVTLFPAYGLYLAVEGRGLSLRVLTGAVAGVVLGLGLAAIFLAPALGLLPFISTDQLTNAAYAPESSFFFSGPASVFAGGIVDNQLVTMGLATGYLLASLLILLTPSLPRLAKLFAGLGVACFLIVSGLLPVFWDIPLIRQVQFPARILPVAELVLISALAAGGVGLSARRVMIALIPAAFATLLVANMAIFRMGMATREGAAAARIVLADLRDAPEYLPHGHPVGLDDKGRADPSLVPLPPQPLVVTDTAQARITHATPEGRHGLQVRITTPVETRVSVRRFYFPHWQVVEIETGRSFTPQPDALRRASWSVPPGTHRYRLVARNAPFEQIGRWVSLISALIILALLILARRWRT